MLWLVIRIIMKSLDPLRAKKIFIRKKLGHTAVSAFVVDVTGSVSLSGDDTLVL